MNHPWPAPNPSDQGAAVLLIVLFFSAAIEVPQTTSVEPIMITPSVSQHELKNLDQPKPLPRQPAAANSLSDQIPHPANIAPISPTPTPEQPTPEPESATPDNHSENTPATAAPALTPLPAPSPTPFTAAGDDADDAEIADLISQIELELDQLDDFDMFELPPPPDTLPETLNPAD